MSLLPGCTDSATGVHYFGTDLPAGVATALSWTQLGVSTFYQSSIVGVSPQLTATSALSVSLQTATIADANNCWILSAYPSTAAGGTIVVTLAGNPATPASFGVSWAVAKL